MSFSISFFARDRGSAQTKLREAYAPESVKALIELAIADVPHEGISGASAGHGMTVGQAAATDGAKVSQTSNRSAPAQRRLCGILVETHGHIDEHGGRSSINLFRVEPYYD